MNKKEEKEWKKTEDRGRKRRRWRAQRRKINNWTVMKKK
jgi:hypothetical protein